MRLERRRSHSCAPRVPAGTAVKHFLRVRSIFRAGTFSRLPRMRLRAAQSQDLWTRATRHVGCARLQEFAVQEALLVRRGDSTRHKVVATRGIECRSIGGGVSRCRVALPAAVCCMEIAQAQLTDLTQTPNQEGAGIVKSPEQQIGAGVGSSTRRRVHRLAHHAARSRARHPARRQLFQRKFTDAQGLGPAPRMASATFMQFPRSAPDSSTVARAAMAVRRFGRFRRRRRDEARQHGRCAASVRPGACRKCSRTKSPASCETSGRTRSMKPGSGTRRSTRTLEQGHQLRLHSRHAGNGTVDTNERGWREQDLRVRPFCR